MARLARTGAVGSCWIRTHRNENENDETKMKSLGTSGTPRVRAIMEWWRPFESAVLERGTTEGPPGTPRSLEFQDARY